MKKPNIKISLIVLVILSFSLIHISLSSAKASKKVAILPFTMNADRDLKFLQKGIVDMLSSRLAWKGEVDILEKAEVEKEAARVKGPLDNKKAIIIGKALKADYVILGSLTVFGESVSIDAKVLDVAESEELVTAFNQSRGMDEVIPTVTSFAQDINEKIMGRYVRAPVYTTGPATRKGPAGLVASGESFEGKGVGHVQAFRVEIRGLDMGDVDGDGKTDLVFITKEKVYVYKWTENIFTQFKAIKGSWTPEYIYVSVGDMNGNGRAEIYVSNAMGTGLSSVVYEWNGNKFAAIAVNQRWFFRVIELPGKGKKLIGQKRVTDGGFSGDIQFLKKEGNGYVSTGALSLPRQANIFNFARADLADLKGKGMIHTVMLNPYERLVLIDSHGEEIWRSEKYFGGTLVHIEDKDSGDDRRAGVGQYVIISPPIFLTDVDKDGQKEVVICRNHSRTGRLLEKARSFTSGKLHFMIWDKVGLTTKYTSRKLTGPIVGYKVIDVDNDGELELVIASVTREAFLAGKPRTQLVVYDLK